jgi:hypothetical protein
VLATVPQDQAGAGSGLLNTIHQGAGAFGVSLVGLTYEAGGAAWGMLGALDLLGLSVIVTGWLLVQMHNAQMAQQSD